MMNLNYPMDHIFLKILKIVFSVWLKNETLTNNSPTQTYINRIENKIKFKIKFKPRHYLKLLISETMNLFGSKEII